MTTITKPKSTKRTVTPETWDKIEKAWTEGKVATVADLSEAFGVPEKTIKNRLDTRQLKRGSQIAEYNAKVKEELDKKAAEDAKLVADRIAETREEHYRASTLAAKLVIKEISDARNAGRELSTIKNNLSSLESAMKVLKLAREERFAVLGVNEANNGSPVDDEEEQLMVSELSSDQIDDMRNRQPAPEDEEDDGLESIKVNDEDLELDEEEVDETS